MDDIKVTPPHYVCLDLETTGFSFRKNHIIDIGLVCMSSDQVLNILVKSVSRVPCKITQLTSITTAQLVSNGITTRQACMQVLMYFMQFAGPCVLIGHNIKTFDMPFLLRMFEQCGLLDVFQRVKIIGLVDTLLLFRQHHKNTFKNHKLGTIYKHVIGTTIPNAHRAVADAEALKQICNSSWFSNHHSLETVPLIEWRDMLDMYWERYLRLSQQTKYEGSFCPQCNICISTYFPHFHVKKKKK